MHSITAAELRARLDRGDNMLLLDVREPHEWRARLIEGARCIPMREVLDHLDQLPHDRDIVVYCRSGVRSAHVIHQLHLQGYSRLYNLSGGIKAWE